MNQITINTNLIISKSNMTAWELFSLYYEYYDNKANQIQELEDNVFFDLLDNVDINDIIDTDGFRNKLKIKIQWK